jgi:hypothetical protein
MRSLADWSVLLRLPAMEDPVFASKWRQYRPRDY